MDSIEDVRAYFLKNYELEDPCTECKNLLESNYLLKFFLAIVISSNQRHRTNLNIIEKSMNITLKNNKTYRLGKSLKIITVNNEETNEIIFFRKTENSIKCYQQTSKILSHDSSFIPKIDFIEMQLQMHVLKKSVCYYIINSSLDKILLVQLVFYDKNHVNFILENY